MPTDRVQLYDTTLRDGSQMEGISLSVEDKIRITKKLDELGFEWIEGGFPGSNPKDAEYFRRLRDVKLRHAKVSAFGGTRKPNTTCETDANIQSMVAADTPGVTLVGKASLYQVTDILETTPEENLAMIADTVRYFKQLGKTVFFDAEHFFDGFYGDPDYSLQCLVTAARAGADALVLCDTNGGMTTRRMLQAIEAVQQRVKDVRLGIHLHNDAGLAVANSLHAVEAGVWQVQGCVNGYGERCGNADILTVAADLKLKYGIDVLDDEQLARLTEVANYVAELANMALNPQTPYVGASAFAHKAGYHVAGIIKDERAYQHVDPALVGNRSRVLVSELSGQRNLLMKLKEVGLDFLSQDEIKQLLELVKEREAQGYQYEGAEASFEMLVRRSLPGYRAPFELEDFVIVERRRVRKGDGANEMLAEAMVKLNINGETVHTAHEGNGPVNALDGAVRKALNPLFPQLERVKLVDYKVRILDSQSATGARVRVLIESTDGTRHWTTVGSSTDIIEASWLALADALEYALTTEG
ncbi:MAG: citramalate synthase [Tepidiforma sp.]|uniref:Citramalate synthase n=1 Tax=Tepidiforma bonchosmolovskayae TaxID=2601677 RepID=A0ABX6C2X9_9CHLR|nr:MULTISPECIES: citramalate synthase [Tepidiforma]QFG02620.1 citramalate synthase [Tepidiforma bonchosmolovskayae]GIW14203.1 MAG: citramalate synthase [Tepidiforma sp.]